MPCSWQTRTGSYCLTCTITSDVSQNNLESSRAKTTSNNSMKRLLSAQVINRSGVRVWVRVAVSVNSVPSGVHEQDPRKEAESLHTNTIDGRWGLLKAWINQSTGLLVEDLEKPVAGQSSRCSPFHHPLGTHSWWIFPIPSLLRYFLLHSPPQKKQGGPSYLALP